LGTNTVDFSVGLVPGATCTMGTIVLSASILYPTNYLPADGRTLSITLNSALFALLANNYGGDGILNFALPNLTSAAPNNTQYLICVSGDVP
jgi:microcystin-dependent protein